MSESFPPAVFNHDVVWLYDLLRRFHREVERSQSAPVSGMIEPDQTRLESYLDTTRQAVAWIQASPILDMPETHPRPYALEAFPPEVNVENESVNVIMRLIRAAAVELSNAQSARYSSRLQPFDEKRFMDLINKIGTFLDDFVRASAVPIDVPESSPEEDQVPDGSLGPDDGSR
jgi:hypothetical protein